MTEQQITELYIQIRVGNWGDIDPAWFRYIDLSGDLSPYEVDHVIFQELLQSIKF